MHFFPQLKLYVFVYLYLYLYLYVEYMYMVNKYILNECLSLLQSILSHGTVADCAVVGKEDPLKGHVPLALCVLRKGERSFSP